MGSDSCGARRHGVTWPHGKAAVIGDDVLKLNSLGEELARVTVPRAVRARQIHAVFPRY